MNHKDSLASQRTIVFITAEYPFGQQETFVENEIIYLSDAFDQIVVLPKSTLGKPRTMPPNCSLGSPYGGVSRQRETTFFGKNGFGLKDTLGNQKLPTAHGKASTNGSHKSKHQRKILQARSPTTAIGLMRERWPQRTLARERDEWL